MNSFRPRHRESIFGALCLAALCSLVVVVGGGLSKAAAQQARAAAQGGGAGNTDNGKKVFSAQKCDMCHGLNGEGGAGEAGGPQITPPPLALPMFLEYVRNPKDPMPPFSTSDVSDAQLTDVYAFLKSAAPAPQAASAPSAAGGNAANGKTVYTSAGCYECHDRDGQGGAGTGPRLAPPLAFAAFAHQVRDPSDQMPPYTVKVLSDAQLADIYAFLQSVPKPPPLESIPLLK